MQKIFLGIIFVVLVPSLGIADDAPVCAPGWVTNTCGDNNGSYTGCALPEWVCCPSASGDGWQWSTPPCPTGQ